MQKTIWITGASSGIGREFARRYAAMGCRLILTARRADRLQALAKELHAAHGTECRIETADLSRAEECSRLCEVLADEHIDIFINNAGFGVCGSILETEEAREEEMVQVNVAAAVPRRGAQDARAGRRHHPECGILCGAAARRALYGGLLRQQSLCGQHDPRRG